MKLTRSTDPGSNGTSGGRIHPLVVLALVLLAASVLGLIESSQVQYDRAVRDDPITWSHALIHGMPRWYTWALLVPVVVLLARWVHRRHVGPGLTVLAHLVIGAVVSIVHVAMFAVLSNLLHGDPDPLAHFRPALLKYTGLTFFGNMATYGAVVGGWHALQLHRRYRDREIEAARLELQTSELRGLLAESQLRRLQAQLEPHFLFNSLHTLGSLMLQGDSTGAIRMVRRLSDLLRRALDAGEKVEHPLREELELVGEYLAIQQLRFEDRMVVSIHADDQVADALIPALLLQPLAENAVRHGIEADATASRVEIRAMLDDSTEDERLRIEVRNDGPGLGTPPRAGAGVGIENTRRRLEALHGDAARLEIRDAPGSGVLAEVTLPLRTATAPATGGGTYEETA